MTGPIAIDTPDYQRGLVSAQKLLATVPAGTDHVTVGVPPNAETLIVTASDVGTNPTVYVEGTGTLYKFPGKLAIQQPFITSAPTWFFDVSQSVDSSVLVQFSAAPGEQWYVYADSAAHLVVDPSKRVDGLGQQYVIPSAPSNLASDHPPVELQWGTTGVSNGQNVQGGLPASQRYRVFTAQVANFSTAAECELLDSTGNWFFQTSSINPAIFGAWPLTGIALTAGSPIVARVTGGASCSVSLGFTTEAV